MPSSHIVVHYHELWLKRGNRAFFLHKLREALRRALGGIEVTRISQPADRLIVEVADAAHVDEALQRLTCVSGISHLAIARVLRRPDLAADPVQTLCEAAWEEVRTEQFATFAVRARRSDKNFPLNAMAVERQVGGYLFDKLQAEGRHVRVDLKSPALTCRIEITRGPLLIYARRILGPGGLPPNTAGRLHVCLLSGGFDSAVAAYKMMRRGAHLSFVHFLGRRRSRGRIFGSRRPPARRAPGPLAIHHQAIPCPVRTAATRNRRASPRSLPHVALSPLDAARRGAHRPAQRRQRRDHRR